MRLVQAIGFETEAYALLDTMAYIKPAVYTLVVGEAMGNAAMLVASGRKGNRFALPHSRMMTCPPRMNRSFGSTVNMMIRAEDLEYNTQVRAEVASVTLDFQALTIFGAIHLPCCKIWV